MDSGSALSMLIFLLVFLATGGAGLLLFFKLERDRRRGIDRLRGLANPAPPPRSEANLLSAALRWPARVGEFLQRGEERRARLRERLARAGLYRPVYPALVLGVRVLLAALLPLLLGLAPYLLGWLPPRGAAVAGALGAALGFLLPGLWLDARTRHRQEALRRGLPDALDMLVLCVEGGVSLTGALQRVADELQAIHPALGLELNILQRETNMGQSAGEAMKRFARRCGLEEVDTLASVLLQSERFGAGVVKALRIHAESSRQDRQQKAEELAQKAAVKILFPTLLCIFPAIFIVLLGPAAQQIMVLMARLK